MRAGTGRIFPGLKIGKPQYVLGTETHVKRHRREDI